MKKISIKLVLIGHLRYPLNLPRIRRFRSSFFKIIGVDVIEILPAPLKDDGYLDASYSQEEIEGIMAPVDGADFIVGVINCQFDDNFYVHRMGENNACISLYGIDRTLIDHGISLENFILKNLVEMAVIVHALGSFTSEDINTLIHLDTRGCLFDMNGDKRDVIYNTERPKVCDSCKAIIKSKIVSDNLVSKLDSELKRIRKPYIHSLELIIKKYPLISFLATFSFGIFINIASMILWILVKK